MARPRLYVRIIALLILFQGISLRASYTLQWQNNDTLSDETGFIIERSDAGGDFVQIATVAPTVTTYQDTTATSLITYAYRVCAFNANGNSDYTNIATNAPTFTTQPPASQAAPVGGTATFTAA